MKLGSNQLLVLSYCGDTFGFRELEDLTGFSRSKIIRIIDSLKRHDLVRYDRWEAGRRYQLTEKGKYYQ